MNGACKNHLDLAIDLLKNENCSNLSRALNFDQKCTNFLSFYKSAYEGTVLIVTMATLYCINLLSLLWPFSFEEDLRENCLSYKNK